MRSCMKSILLIDDDPFLLNALQRLLHPHFSEWKVTTASNGMEAIRLMTERAFDLVVTDILMPEQDGLGLIREVRRRHPATKLIAMTGGGKNVGLEVLDVARALGAHAAFEKPFASAVFLDTIKDLLSGPLECGALDAQPWNARVGALTQPYPG